MSGGSGMNYVLYTNNTSKHLFRKESHFYNGNGSVPGAPLRLAPGQSLQGQQLAWELQGPIKFAIAYVDSEEELPTTRKFITAFDIIPRQTVGPFGSNSAPSFSMTLGEGESIKELIVRHGFVIDAFGFVVADSTGATISTQIFGGEGGTEERITLQPGEIIRQISGTHGKYAHSDVSTVIAILRIQTSVKLYSFGSLQLVTSAADFTSGVNLHRIIGFFGRHSNFLESIGCVMGNTVLPNKVYAESGAAGPTNWSDVDKKLVQSAQSVVHVNDDLGVKIEATVADTGYGTAIYSEN